MSRHAGRLTPVLLPCRVLQRTRGQLGKSDGGSLGLVLEMKRNTVMLVLPLNGAFTPHICGVSDRAGLNQRAAKLCLDNRELKSARRGPWVFPRSSAELNPGMALSMTFRR